MCVYVESLTKAFIEASSEYLPFELHSLIDGNSSADSIITCLILLMLPLDASSLLLSALLADTVLELPRRLFYTSVQLTAWPYSSLAVEKLHHTADLWPIASPAGAAAASARLIGRPTALWTQLIHRVSGSRALHLLLFPFLHLFEVLTGTETLKQSRQGRGDEIYFVAIVRRQVNCNLCYFFENHLITCMHDSNFKFIFSLTLIWF